MGKDRTLEIIKNEIERQIKDPVGYCYGVSSISKLRELLSFLSTLESEKPMNQDGLEEEFNHYCFDFKDPDTGEDIPKNQISFNVEDALNVARHFAQWGAENLKK